MQLLSGKPAAAPVLPPESTQPAGEPITEPTPAPQPAVTQAPERSPEPQPAQPVVTPSVMAPDTKSAVPDVPNVMPRVPVTLDIARKRVAAQAPPPVAPPPKVEQKAVVPDHVVPAAPKIEQPRTEVVRPAMKDESVTLDASFFEQDEYKAPAKPSVTITVDPVEIEKARRFARLVVSDIVLYNQESVAEGIAKGTFFELLKEDITEGRALYDKRVPAAVRASMDYYQEAFDNFIAAKQKQR